MDSACLPELPRRTFMAKLAGGLLAAPLVADAMASGTLGVTDSDRIMALQMVGPYAELPAESLERYWSHWRIDAEKSREAFRIVAKEFEALENGEAVILLPDGSRWVSTGSLLDVHTSDQKFESDNTFLQALHRALLNHRAKERHFGPLLPQVFLDAETLELCRGFCVECGAWTCLEADDHA